MRRGDEAAPSVELGAVSPGQDGWLAANAIVPLESREVQVWKVCAGLGGDVEEACRAVLSSDEVERMNRMRVGIAREEFLVGRGLLRVLLGAALGVSARSLEFGKGVDGKPSVQGMGFNVSHSRGLVLIALCRGEPVGVDVEWMNPEIEALDIARSSFAPEEIAGMEQAAEDERAGMFYRCWTRKEAVAKAHGAGLTMDLSTLIVPTSDAGETGVRLMGGDVYFVRPLDVGEGYSGALALGAGGLAVRRFEMGPRFISSLRA